MVALDRPTVRAFGREESLKPGMLLTVGIEAQARTSPAVPELAIVGDRFHTKPLRRFLQSVDRYQVLGLSRGRFQVFEGNRNRLEELKPMAGGVEDKPTLKLAANNG